MAQIKKTFLQTGALLAFMAALIFIPRVQRLGAYITADEQWTLNGSGGFYYALSNKHFEDAIFVKHPAVTTFYAGAAGFLTFFPEYSKVGALPMPDTTMLTKLTNHQVPYLHLLAGSRLFIILFQTILLLAAFQLVRSIFSTRIAVAGILLLSFEPFFFAHSRLLTTDGLLSTTFFTTTLAVIRYTQTHQKKYLYFTGLFAALAYLTKTPSIILFPLVGLLMLLDLWRRQRSSRQKIRWGTQLAAPFGIFILFTAATVYVLWPALWKSPFTAIQILQYAFETSAGEHTSQMFFNGEVIPEGIFQARHFYFYPLNYLWRATPVTLVGLAAAFAGLFQKSSSLIKKYRWPVLSLGLLAVLFTIFMSFSAKRADRYLLPVFPPLSLIAAAGWVSISGALAARAGRFQKQFAPAALGLVILLQILPVIQTFPYYLSYYNPVMGGSQKAPEVMMIGWGEGLEQAADYLNQKTDPAGQVIFTWYPQIMDYLARGTVYKLPISYPIDDEYLADMLAADYAVTYIHQWQRRSSARLLDYLEDKPVEHSIWINGIEYVRIYNMKAIQEGTP